MSTSLGRWLRRLTAEDSAVEAAELSSEIKTSGCQAAVACGRGQQVSLIGRLRAVELRPTEAVATLVAELYDGTDAVQLIWLGRRSIPGVDPGRTVRARGRLAVKDGHKVLYNPDYQLMPAHV